jgi:Radical SAM superfamily./C-methyltransferase.
MNDSNFSTKIKHINNILNNINPNKNIVIYGSGEHTWKLFQYTDILNKNIKYIVDRNNYGFKLYGKNIENIEKISKDIPDIIIISSYRYQEQMFEFILNELEYKGEIIKLYDKNDSGPFYVENVPQYLNNSKRICHYNELFINHKGDIYPCCRTCNNENMKMGNIKDFDIDNKIQNYYGNCSCGNYKLMKSSSEDVINIAFLNIELSLFCQAKCSMCCVNAPLWNNEYDLYEDLTSFIKKINPSTILVQGGEVLVQKKSIEWLKIIKEKNSEIKLAIVTNGNLPISMINTVESLFSGVTISINGFQEETYKRIMGLELSNMIRFAEGLIDNKKVNLNLKYLISPINIHEVNLFLDWAINRKAGAIEIADANTDIYIKFNTFDDYWRKIIDRTAIEIRKTIIKNIENLENNNQRILITSSVKEMFGLDEEFVSSNRLDKVIKCFA